MLEPSSNTITIAPKITQIAAKTGLETVIPVFQAFFISNIISYIRILLKKSLLKPFDTLILKIKLA
jgi:hypothetical protein